jgi:hypothetical protein
MTKTRKPPTVSFVHSRVGPPKYSPEEVSGLFEQSNRLKAHISILKEEVINKESQLAGLEKLLKQVSLLK